jgi:hypothetical protein
MEFAGLSRGPFVSECQKIRQRRLRGSFTAKPPRTEPTQDIAQYLLTGTTNGIYLSVYIEVSLVSKNPVC